MITKKCKNCHKSKSEKSFYIKQRYSKKQGHYTGLSTLCKLCTIRINNKRDSYQNSESRRLSNRKIVNEEKKKPCTDCKQSFPAVCMDFDHRDRTQKTRGVTAMMGQKEDTLRNEIAKCDLVCSNCHRIRTAKALNWKYATADFEDFGLEPMR